jgi:hypothetical protein
MRDYYTAHRTFVVVAFYMLALYHPPTFSGRCFFPAIFPAAMIALYCFDYLMTFISHSSLVSIAKVFVQPPSYTDLTRIQVIES